jgi:hypothetical protein
VCRAVRGKKEEGRRAEDRVDIKKAWRKGNYLRGRPRVGFFRILACLQKRSIIFI